MDVLGQAHFNIALIAEALGQKEKAQKHYHFYLADYKGKGERKISSLEPEKEEQFGDWPKLMKEREAYLKKPLIPQKDLVNELKQGVEKLQKVAKDFIDASGSPKTPVPYAVESYCVIPFLYTTYGQAVLKLAKGDHDLENELKKVSGPIFDKAQEFAQGCLEAAEKNNTNGPEYRDVLKAWGWKKDASLDKQVSTILANLEKKSPWSEPLDVNMKESAIIEGHLKDQTIEKSWLKLARIRFLSKHYGLSRLTYIDALNKDPNSSELLSGLAVVEQKSSPNEEQHILALFEKAGDKGSAYAWANAAYIHLKEGRLQKGKEDLKKALMGGAFEGDENFKGQVKELTGP
jgi:tetratricopeptide (TPR) repeat protein